MSRKIQLETAYKAVLDDITKFCKAHNRKLPTLVAVSKYKPSEDIEILYQLGQRHFGENYVQELGEKAKILPKDIKWHFIGNLQTGKCKIAREIPNLFAVETLDSAAKATKLSNQRGQVPDAQPLHVFIQVNTSGEEQKAGIAATVKDVESLALHILKDCPSLKLCGLMTIGSVTNSKSDGPNHDFELLSNLKNELQTSLANNGFNVDLELSMGMSSDFLEAIRQGSTNVRVGSSIFGGRVTKEEYKSGAGAEA